MTRSRIRLAIVLAAAGALASCAAPRLQTRSPYVAIPELAIWGRLSFGRGIPTGGEVSEDDWTKFLAEVVTPRFPGGFAVLRSEGQWRHKSGEIMRERSYILDVNHADDRAGDRLVEEIVAEYKRRFALEAVFRTRLHVEVTL